MSSSSTSKTNDRSSAVNSHSTLGQQKNCLYTEKTLKMLIEGFCDDNDTRNRNQLFLAFPSIPRAQVYSLCDRMKIYLEQDPGLTTDQMLTLLMETKPGPQPDGTEYEKKSILFLIDLYTVHFRYKPDMENLQIMAKHVMGKPKSKTVSREWLQTIIDEAEDYSASHPRKQELGMLRSRNVDVMLPALMQQKIWEFGLEGEDKKDFENYITTTRKAHSGDELIEALKQLPAHLKKKTTVFKYVFYMDEMADSVGNTLKKKRYGKTKVPTVEATPVGEGPKLTTMTIVESLHNTLLGPMFISERKTPQNFSNYTTDEAVHIYSASGGTTQDVMPLIAREVIALLPKERPVGGMMDWTGVHHSLEAMKLFAENDISIFPLGGRTGIWRDVCDARAIHGKIHGDYTKKANERTRLTGMALEFLEKIEIVSDAQMLVSKMDVLQSLVQVAAPCKKLYTLDLCWERAMDLIKEESLELYDLEKDIQVEFDVLVTELPTECKEKVGARLANAMEALRYILHVFPIGIGFFVQTLFSLVTVPNINERTNAGQRQLPIARDDKGCQTFLSQVLSPRKKIWFVGRKSLKKRLAWK